MACGSAQDEVIRQVVIRALAEDVTEIGDVSTLATVGDEVTTTARFLAKATGTLAGLTVARLVFARVDPALEVSFTAKDGDAITRGTYFGEVRGKARSILVAERVALNIMQRMSGIATLTHRMVQAVGTNRARILDTRKTAPGLRILDKLAVRIGGGTNHRMGLSDMVMIKDNHIAAAGGLTKAVASVTQYLTKIDKVGQIKVELETRTLDEVKEAVSLSGVDRLMLDNMVTVDSEGRVDTSMLQEALALVPDHFETECSGNVTLNSVPAIAATGVHFISSGALTHSVTALDISLKINLRTSINT